MRLSGTVIWYINLSKKEFAQGVLSPTCIIILIFKEHGDKVLWQQNFSISLLCKKTHLEVLPHKISYENYYIFKKNSQTNNRNESKLNEKETQKLKRIKNTKNLHSSAISYIYKQVNLLHQSESTKYLHIQKVLTNYIYIIPWWDFSQAINALSVKPKLEPNRKT